MVRWGFADACEGKIFDDLAEAGIPVPPRDRDRRPLGLPPLTDGPAVQFDDYGVDLKMMVVWLGVGESGQNSPLVRSLRRLAGRQRAR